MDVWGGDEDLDYSQLTARIRQTDEKLEQLDDERLKMSRALDEFAVAMRSDVRDLDRVHETLRGVSPESARQMDRQTRESERVLRHWIADRHEQTDATYRKLKETLESERRDLSKRREAL
jgi:flagellar biosynthesis chaperone FliJ